MCRCSTLISLPISLWLIVLVLGQNEISDIPSVLSLKEQIQDPWIAAEKRKLLNSLELDSAPNFYLNKNDVPPRIFTTTPSPIRPKTKALLSNQHCQTATEVCFEAIMPQLEESERITEVQLWLYVAPISSTPFFHLKIEEIVDSDTEINSRVILIDDSAAAWQSITITPWYQTEDSLLADAGDLGGLKIFRVSCLGCSSTPEFTLGFNDSKKPYLEFTTVLPKSGPDCIPGVYGICCLKSFYVNFTSLGWSKWILSPAGYLANYCVGSCRPLISDFSPHSEVRQVALENEANGQISDEKYPCCTPKKFKPLTIRYTTNGRSVKKKTLKNMQALSCGC